MINRIINQIGSGLEKLLNLTPDPGKVTLIPVKKYAPTPEPNGERYVAMFNPDQWMDRRAFVFRDPQNPGDAGAVQRFHVERPRDLSFELLLDGTGAAGGEKKEVEKELEKLYKTVGFNGKIHRPNKLIVVWGKFLFQGVVKSVDVTYTLFKPDGTPLRAKVRLSFKYDTDNVTQVLESDRHTADLTHLRTVHAGERLDNLAHAIYETNDYLLQLAQANGLTSFRNLTEGTELFFPPIEK